MKWTVERVEINKKRLEIEADTEAEMLDRLNQAAIDEWQHQAEPSVSFSVFQHQTSAKAGQPPPETI